METEEIEIDLREVMLQLWNNLFIILLSAIIGALSMYYISNVLIDKKFQSSTSIYVISQQDNQTLTYSDLQTGTQLTKDYAQLVTSRTVTNQVIADLDLQNRYDDMKNITPDALANMISVTMQQDTRILKITVTDTNPVRAQDLANAVREAASKHIYKVMDIESVNIVDFANLPENPVSPKVNRNTVIGALIGIVISIAVIVILFILDDSVKTPDDVKRYLNLSVLASIPVDERLEAEARKRRKKKTERYGSVPAEATDESES